ncbi:hypothetical protein [Corallococcus macrosporus]|uniref:Lipoprotein n=1 Tax=Corallococcus macrosporus DSM 14697 TaxID=1189310 RepID=A0A250K2M7_9BACT|nr:hypothetical protein [Corallococcus macrosporus]ATB50253.1 hypothetical protein MYMAC_005908 [Corallococcus macrosporus DSM 14697]
MRLKRSFLLPLAVLSLGVLPACSDDGDDNPPGTDAGADAGMDAGTDAGTGADAGDDNPGPSTEPGTCPANTLLCELFDSGNDTNGWTPSSENASIQVDSTRTRNGPGALHVVTEDGHDERQRPGTAIAQWQKRIPAFETQLFVRAHVYLRSLPGAFGQMGTFFVLSNFDADFGGFELQVMQDSGFALDDWSFREGQGWNRQPEPIQLGMDAGRWVCLEWEVRRDSTSSTHGNTRVYVDGALAHDFTNIGMRAFNNFSVGYGFVHPLGASGSETWIDNVVVSTQRVGCD